jgi:hypothetical protein
VYLDFTRYGHALIFIVGTSTTTTKQGKKQGKVANEIGTEIMKRLRDDDYVKPLLEEDGLVLCEAHIHVNPGNELEERVRVDDNVAEGVRRSAFGGAFILSRKAPWV